MRNVPALARLWQSPDALGAFRMYTAKRDGQVVLLSSCWLRFPDPAKGFTNRATDDHLFVNSYELCRILKVDRATGDVVWELGEGGDFELLAGEWFCNQHDPELQPDGSWLVYDNSLEGPSRVVEVAVDEETMTAEIVWSFPGPAE